MVGGSLRMEKPPLPSLTAVWVLCTAAVWPLERALGWLMAWLLVTVIVSEPWEIATCESRTVEVATMVPVRSFITMRARVSLVLSICPSSAARRSSARRA